MSKVFFEHLELPQLDIYLGVGRGGFTSTGLSTSDRLNPTAQYRRQPFDGLRTRLRIGGKEVVGAYE